VLARQTTLLMAFLPIALAIVAILASSMAAAGPCPPSGSGGC
jgi:hypothetical protein